MLSLQLRRAVVEINNLLVKIELKNNTFCVEKFGEPVANFHMFGV